jgi:N utilization substance protein A
MNQEMLRIIDSIARDRNVDKESLFVDIEQAMISAARKHFNAPDTEEFTCEVDRLTGQITLFRNQEEIPLASLGRIPAQTAKQVMIQKFREDERASIFDEFQGRIGEIVTGTAQRYEGGSMVIGVGRAEGFMPRSEQIPGEQHQPGERVRCMILDVRDVGSQVKIVLSRAHPDFIQRLFEVEVPEVSERIIEIKAMAREPGHRTKVAVSSIDSKVDAVGACVGVRGSRIKNIVDELGGEKIDIVRWNESSQVLIANALRPAEVVEISLCFELGRATVVVNEDQLSLAIGKRGQNVRLAARLTNWDVDILTPGEFSKGLEIMEQALRSIEGMTEEMLDRMAALGLISVFDIEEVGVDTLVDQLGELGMSEDLATTAVSTCSERAKEVAEQQQREREEEERRRASGEVFEGEDERTAAQAAAILGMGDLPASDTEAEPQAAEPAPEESSGDIVDMLMQSRPTADTPADVAMAQEQAAEAEQPDSSPAGSEIEQSPEETDVARLAQGEEEQPAEGEDGENPPSSTQA